MDNTVLLYNNALNLNLKQTMNNVNDVLYNMQSLKQFQWNIDQIQKMKDGAQMQVNLAALALWRNFILDEGWVGARLLRNLVRKYFPLNDDEIVKYETFRGWYYHESWYYITNLNVIKRKGTYFSIEDRNYRIESNNKRINAKDVLELWDFFYDATAFDEIPYFKSWPGAVYKHSCYIDFQHAPNYFSHQGLASNRFTSWSWDLVTLMNGNQTRDLLQNDGFFAQMGVNNISETLTHLQDIVGSSYEITEEMKNEIITRLEQKGIALYSYLPISKEFIFQHQNELDWAVMQKNPRIQWDWELINLYLRKVKETTSEDKWPQYLLGSKAMYEFVGNYLNDEILSDIEKLYNI